MPTEGQILEPQNEACILNKFFVIWKYNQIENLIPNRGDILIRVKVKVSI